MKFSYSRVSTYNQCPFKFKLHYLDELRTLPNTDANNALYLGTAVHTGIEKTVEDAIAQYFSNYPVIDDLHVNEAIKIEHVVNLAKEKLPKGEYEVEIDTEEFKGFIDLLVPKGNKHFDIYDFKYSNNVDRYMESGQLHIYKHFYELTHLSHKIDNLYYVFLPKTMIRQKNSKREQETLFQFRQRLQSTLDEMEVTIQHVEYDPQKVEEYLAAVREIRMATEFPKQESRLCDWCEFKDYCQKGDTTMIILPENKRRDIAKIEKKVIWLYGAPFTGKTTLANKFPDPLMLNTDGNVGNVDAPYIAIKDQVTTNGRMTTRKSAWEVFNEVIDELEKKQNDFKTIIVDLLEDTYEYCRTAKYKELKIEHESDAGFGKGYDIVRKAFLDAIKRLVNLDYENIILISHEDSSKNITNKSGGSLTTIRPNIQEKLASKVAGMVGLVGRVVADGKVRTLSFKSNELVFGGGRLNVEGMEIPLEYDKLMEVYNDANTTTKTNGVSGSSRRDSEARAAR